MFKLPKPVNACQQEFEILCQRGGGISGGPARTKVQELLRNYGQRLNQHGFESMRQQIECYPEANPWHICFAFGLSWGHLAKLDIDFTGAAIGLLEQWNDQDLRTTRSFCLERGPEPIEFSLRGAQMLFGQVILPSALPDTLAKLSLAQERWLSPILNPSSRPRYIGSWNATAMFMSALFAQPELAALQREPRPVLPPGGPIVAGIRILHRTHVVNESPDGSELDDESFEPGALYQNNEIMAGLLRGRDDWSLLDVHTGIYMLGTRDLRSDTWC